MADEGKKRTNWDNAAVIIQAVAAIAIPISVIALVVGVRQFNAQQKASARQTLDQQRQATLGSYLSEMSALVLQHDLSRSKSKPARALARARTDTAVRNLDGARKGTLIQYLEEAGLIEQPHPIVLLFQDNLSGAVFTDTDLSRAALSTSNLMGAHLTGATLIRTDLSGTNLTGANLTGANLTGANLTRANLTRANLTRANLSCVTENTALYCAQLAGINWK